ncbi:hypothetical protein KFZ58_14610 [Virgibacillus sp. NKC19-16]|uniref:tetratricopeptide repeat protein n=1 Tax=Virgibacillus salidurans TaxID=2831673 RepID=UPI001F22788C|nr:hypothetical protein [Virgibacillus sp. NKC19-16]UJL45615.1 hypothetical protein KFZ58_14610 [Virgibacillus sp. NKC19-16]
MTQFQAHQKKKNLTLTPQQLAIYKQSKVLEATDEAGDYFYLFFYKNDFLTGIHADDIDTDTHVHRAFTEGLHFEGSHPLTKQLIRAYRNIHFLPIEKLYKKIQDTSYSQLETALIKTYFDAFSSTDSIHKVLKDTFNHYQRNGQSLASYQLLNIYLNYDNTNTFARDMISGAQFKNQSKMYQDLEKLSEKDPIQLESLCFDNLYHTEHVMMLLQLYKEQNRWTDELALRITLLKSHFTPENFTAIRVMIEPLPTDEQMTLLQELNQSNNNPVLHEALITKLLASGKPNDILEFMMTTKVQPDEEQLTGIITHIEQAGLTDLTSFFKNGNYRLLELSKNPQTIERLATPFISSFLQDHTIGEILDWFQPFRDANFHLPVEQKLLKMQTLVDDPDRQFNLGELYLYFRQLEKALDCFKWEVELDPQAHSSVKYVAKIYQELGYPDEAAAYQQLLQMQK